MADTFGEHLRALYEARGYSLNRFGKQLTPHHKTVERWVNNETRPNFENLAEIADVLGITLDELIRYKD